MSYPQKIKSYLKVIEIVSGNKRVTLKLIQQSLRNDELPDSVSSINRAIRDLRDMGYEISWNKEGNYELEHGPSDKSKLLYDVMNLMQYANFLQEVSESPAEHINWIDFDERVVSKGAEYLSAIFAALRKNQWLEIEYKNFRDDKLRTHKLAPLLLKEYNSRWYLFAVLKAPANKKQDEAYFFGLDRIKKMSILKEKIPKGLFQQLPAVQKLKKENHFRGEIIPTELMKDVMGVIFSRENVQEVIIKIDPSQAPYVKSQPWHHTQTILRDEPDDFRICLYLRPNEELEYQILSFTGRAEVIQPETLRNKIKNILKESLSLYNNKTK